MDFEIIDSDKRSKCLVLKDFKYRIFRVNKNGTLIWRCFIKKCTSTVTTCSEMKHILKVNSSIHKHKQERAVTVEIQKVRIECKCNAPKDINKIPQKIIQKEISSIKNNTTIAGSNASSSTKPAIYDESKKLQETLSKNLEGALNFLPNCDIVTFQNEKMTYVYKQDKMVIVTCKKNIEFLCNHCDEYLADSTFRYKPNFFYQQYSIHGWSRNYCFPLIHCFLTSKTETCYLNMWSNIKKLCMELGQVLNINIIHLDFEIAAHNAVKKAFTGVKVKSCRFHFGQALWLKIQSIIDLRRPYYEYLNETGQWLKMFFGLPYLPVHEITEAFDELMSICPPQDECTSFGHYIFDNYIKGQFPVDIWAHPIGENITTIKSSNGAERFYQRFNSEFNSGNPSIFKVIDVLRNIHIDTVKRMDQYLNGMENIVLPTEKQKQEQLFECWETFLKDRNRLEFLKRAGNHF